MPRGVTAIRAVLAEASDVFEATVPGSMLEASCAIPLSLRGSPASTCFFVVRTTYIDVRHAGAHMMIWYARWALVWYNLGRSSPFFRRDRNDHDVLPLHIALDNEAPT